jgi:hypothetical protein
VFGTIQFLITLILKVNYTLGLEQSRQIYLPDLDVNGAKSTPGIYSGNFGKGTNKNLKNKVKNNYKNNTIIHYSNNTICLAVFSYACVLNGIFSSVCPGF